MKLRYSIVFLLLILSNTINSQEITINLVISQPSKLIADAGNDIYISNNQSITLGNDIVRKGGTPEFTYQWVSESGEHFNSQTLEINKPGRYILTITDANGCTSSDSVQVIQNLSTRDFIREQFYTYPNPANGIFNINTQSLKHPVKILIIDIYGKTVYNKTLNISQLHQINLENLKKGFYVIGVETAEAKYFRRLVIK